MADTTEQIKQKIALELENARLYTSFLLPQIALFVTLFFTEQYLKNYHAARYILGGGVLIGIFFVLLLRHDHISRARQLIDDI